MTEEEEEEEQQQEDEFKGIRPREQACGQKDGLTRNPDNDI